MRFHYFSLLFRRFRYLLLMPAIIAARCRITHADAAMLIFAMLMPAAAMLLFTPMLFFVLPAPCC